MGKNLICMKIIADGRGKDSLIDLEDSSEANDKMSGKFSGLCKSSFERLIMIDLTFLF